MKYPSKFLAAVVTAGICMSAHGAPVQHAFLVQNSGWMEPFYVDSASQFKPLVTAVANAVSAPDDQVFTLAFSQATEKNVSPLLLGQGHGAAQVRAHVAGLELAHKSSGPALADTDFKEAVTRTIMGPFKSAPGILWIFTNNKNSPNNDLQTAARNREFYRLVHLEPSIKKTVVFPLRMPVQGKLYAAKGLMVYALAYGQPAADALDRILKEGKLSKVLTNPPARLKPVDQDAVRIVPRSIENSGNVKVSLGNDGRTVVLDVNADKLVPQVVLQASLQNLFYPYVIEQASLSAGLSQKGVVTSLQVTPDRIRGLQPGEGQLAKVTFALPMAQIGSSWSASAIAAMGKQVLLPMTANINLDGQKLGLASDFANQLKELFAGDPISEVFTPPESVHASQVHLPMVVRIQYPLLPVFVVIGGILAVLLGLVGLGLVSRVPRRVVVHVNGTQRQVLLKAFQTLAVRDADGNIAGDIKRGLGKPRITRVAEGHALRLG